MRPVRRSRANPGHFLPEPLAIFVICDALAARLFKKQGFGARVLGPQVLHKHERQNLRMDGHDPVLPGFGFPTSCHLLPVRSICLVRRVMSSPGRQPL